MISKPIIDKFFKDFTKHRNKTIRVVISSCKPFPNILKYKGTFGVTEILCSFRLVLEVKADKEIPESSRLEFLEMFLASNIALSDVEDNTSRPMSRGGIADLLLSRILLAICQKS